MKKISVIIPCYNVEQYIDQCVDSVIHQTYGIDNLEILLVDDCSTDGTLKKLYEWEHRYPNNIILLPLEKNIRQGGARNVGLQYASGQYISFIDSDDWIDLEMYEMMQKKIEEYHCDIVGCGMYRNHQNGSEDVFSQNEKDSYYSCEKNVVEGGSNLPDIPGGIVCRLYDIRFLKECNVLFPEGLKYEDNYWGMVTDLYRHSEYLMKECYYHYRENPTSTLLSRNDYSHFDRLEIEKMKIEKYKELGVFEKNKEEYEYYFMLLYYYNTCFLMVARFDEPPYEQFCKMQREILEIFPDYMQNKRIQRDADDLFKELMRLIPMDISKEQFNYIFQAYKENMNAPQKENHEN